MQTGDTKKPRVNYFDRQKLPTSKAFTDFMQVWSFAKGDEIRIKLQQYQYRLFAVTGANSRSPWLAGALTLFSQSGGDLVYIFVRQEERGKGLGKLLLEAIAQKILEDPNCIDKKLVLEVAHSNVKARGLYESFGMQQIGMRRRYYRSGEDAIVFEKALD